MSMPKPVCPNMATAPLPRPAGGPDGAGAARRLLELDAQPPAAGIRLPEGAERKVCLGAASLHAGHLRGIGPEPGRILIPGDGAAGDQGAQDRPACPAMAATRRLRATTSSRYGLPRTCRL